MLTFVPLQEAFFVRGERRSEIPSREASGAAGLEVLAAGRHLCERRGYYCYKFHHLSQMRKMDGKILKGGLEPDGEGGSEAIISVSGCYFSSERRYSHR